MELVNDKNKVAQYREHAKAIVEKMTLEEKVFQTLHTAPAIPREGVKAYNWWNEALHGVARAGVATVFPQAIGLAATFDEDFIEEVATAISDEARAKYNMQQKYDDTDIYKGLTFWSPNVNIFRDPRWGRGHETFGEDPYLSSRLGVRFVQGMQGHDKNYMKTAACAKHFAVHSGPEGIRHSFDAIVNKQDLHETYLPAFKACVEEGKVEAIMGAYNRTNGQPCCGHKELLQDILRDTWGFSGHVVSDCWAIKDFHEYHHVTNTAVESVAMALKNGCDLNCGNLFIYLKQAVEEGLVSEERLDEAVTNLFTTRMKLGVLEEKGDNPFDQIPYTVVDSTKMQKLNLEAAKRCMVLLKNQDKLLPLNKDTIKTIGVIGPNANNRRALVGNYEGTASRYFTVLEGIQDYVGDDVRVMTSEGCHLYGDRMSGLGQKNDRLSEVKGVCEASDVVVVCLGLDASLEGEEGDTSNQFASGDKANLDLPGQQHKVLETAYESGKPVILVLLSGSALAITWAQEHVPAIIQGWYPGAQGGRALAQVLFGEASPEGKLPITFYKTTEELPDFTDYNMTNRTYRYMQNEALYPFGYGLSYTKFEYSDLSVLDEEITEEGVKVSVKVTNVGEMVGRETVQAYVKVHQEGTPHAQLKAIKKVLLQPKESKEVEIVLPKSSFELYDASGEKQLYAGDYTVYIGGGQPDQRTQDLTGNQVLATTIAVR